MTGGPGDVTPAAEAQQVYAQVRANIAFEHMAMAVLVASALSGAFVFVLNNAAALVAGQWGLMTAISAFYAAFFFSSISFLGGFFAAVAVGLPLFLALERLKRRYVWPFVVAGLAMELTAAGLVFGRAPVFSDFAAVETAPLLVPGVLAAFLFGRRIKPLWRAAERAEKADRSAGRKIVRLH